MKKSTLAILFCSLIWMSCSSSKKEDDLLMPKVIKQESARLNEFFENSFEDRLRRYPMFETYVGKKKYYGLFDDLSDSFLDSENAVQKEELRRLRLFNFNELSESDQISYRIYERQVKENIEGYRYRYHDYLVNQMFGWQAYFVSFMVNMHGVQTYEDMVSYVERLERSGKLFEQLIASLKTREKKGFILPKFIFPHVIENSKNVVQGAPFTSKGKNVLWTDLNKKLSKVSASSTKKAALRARGKKALLQVVGPAYQNLIAYLTELEKKATHDAGVWKFPDGDDYYRFKLRSITTTDLSPSQIHRIGLDEVKRIHQEMNAIKDQVHFSGTLQEFFVHLRTSPEFRYSNDQKGRQAYLKETRKLISNMKGRLKEMFGVLPKAALDVKRVEAFRERAAGKAFYQGPAEDGSRPGTYFVNLYDMNEMPKYEIEALAYHEAIPGHHMQISIAYELDRMPSFRKYSHFTAYSEGWGLYSELVPKEMGLYQDPYSDFGRLAMELWRACRLVVDTGIHDKRWTREQAIDYLVENTPNPKQDIVKAVERYVVMPGQATAYKIGMLKILELRERARKKLGSRFDIREFHDTVLSQGPVPLSMLEEMVDAYIDEKKGS